MQLGGRKRRKEGDNGATKEEGNLGKGSVVGGEGENGKKKRERRRRKEEEGRTVSQFVFLISQCFAHSRHVIKAAGSYHTLAH